MKPLNEECNEEAGDCRADCYDDYRARDKYCADRYVPPTTAPPPTRSVPAPSPTRPLSLPPDVVPSRANQLTNKDGPDYRVLIPAITVPILLIAFWCLVRLVSQMAEGDDTVASGCIDHPISTTPYSKKEVVAKVYKSAKEERLGVTMKKSQSDGPIVVSEISVTSPFAGTALEVGMQIKSINGAVITAEDPVEFAATLIKESPDEVFVVAEKVLYGANVAHVAATSSSTITTAITAAPDIATTPEQQQQSSSSTETPDESDVSLQMAEKGEGTRPDSTSSRYVPAGNTNRFLKWVQQNNKERT